MTPMFWEIADLGWKEAYSEQNFLLFVNNFEDSLSGKGMIYHREDCVPDEIKM